MKNKKLKVAVYGTLRKGSGNHYLLKSSKYIGDDLIDGFDLYSLGCFPALVENEDSNCKIKVEVYEIKQEVMDSLDKLEGYPSFYNRKIIKTKHGESYIYFVESLSNNNLRIFSGDWMKYSSTYNY